MSSPYKVKQSRQQWKQKATSRADDNRYLRKELQRVKWEREVYKKRAKQAELGAQRPALQNRLGKVDLVQVSLQLFVEARIGFRAVSRVLDVLATPLGLTKAPCPQTIINWVTRLSIARLQDAPERLKSP